MLGFKEYRNRLTEATPEAGMRPEDVLSNEKAENIQKQVNQVVDAWVADLKRTLMNPMTPLAQRRGLWDRFKNSMSNMWHGRYNQSNPYFWKNKLGDDLGATQESFNPNNLSLADYKSLRDICESLEEQLNEDAPTGAENLRLVGIIDKKAQELKQTLMSIVGGAGDGSPMSAASASMGKPEEPEPAAASLNPVEEEPNSKMEKNMDQIIAIITAWGKNGKLDAKKAQDLIDRLESKKASIRKIAEDDFNLIKNDFEAKASASPSPASASPSPSSADSSPASADSEHGVYFTPPTTGKKWSELTDDEMNRWNRYGGGKAHQGSSMIDGCLKDHGIRNMPWILRIGDPRREILDAQKRNVLPVSKECKGLREKSHWHKVMHDLDRWEHHESPIKSVSELLARVEKAKTATAEARRRMPRSTAPSDVDVARDAAMGGDSESPNSAPDSTSSPTPTPEPTPTPTPTPSLKDRVGSIGNEVPEVKKFTGDGSGLSEPMHKGEDVPDAPASLADAPPDLKTRVAGIDGAEAIPNPMPEENPVRQKGLTGRIKTLSDEKTKLKGRIEALSDKETKEQLLKRLENIKDRADIAKLKEELEAHELVDMPFEWNTTDMKNFYKQRLHERKGVPQHLIEHKKIEMLSFTERTKYFKEQLQKR